MIPKYCINIFLVIIFIIILFNLKQNLNNNFKNNSNNIIEKFGTVREHNVDRIDEKINYTLAKQIQDIYDAIKNTTDNSLKNRVESVYNSARNLYERIGKNKILCEREYDADYYDIIKNYQEPIENLKCLKPFSDILDGKYNLSDCAKRCDENIDCLSFSHDVNTNDCRLSTICHDKNNTTIKNFSNNLYIKKGYNSKDIVGDEGAYIKNYKLDKNKQCNNLCHNDIIGSSSITKTVHDCAERCEEKNSRDDKCVAFEYNFTDRECTLRKECQQGTHLVNSNKYKCDKGQINNERIIDSISFNIDVNRNLSDSVLDYYSELELKKKCNKKCDENVECDAFTYEFTSSENNCTLYQDLDKQRKKEINVQKDIELKFDNICIKPKNSIIKNLYTKKDSIPEISRCEALCEENVNNDTPYVKFYKNINDINYSYITFNSMYNIKNIEDFNISQYKYIGIKYGYKVSFLNNENYVSIQKVFQNPDDYNLNIDELKKNIHDDDVDDDKQWRNKINVILIEKLEKDCRGRMSSCRYDENDNKYKKQFTLFYGTTDEEKKNMLEECRKDAIDNFGEVSANLYFPSLEPIECINEDIDCLGHWSTCNNLGSSSNNKYVTTWIEREPINGNGTCMDVFDNYIYSDGISSCGSGPNEGYNKNSEDIQKYCIPNNDTTPFLVDGSYYKQEIGSDGTPIDKYYGSDGTEITNPGSSIGVSVIPYAGSGNVCSR
jgi:hypothetical protein